MTLQVLTASLLKEGLVAYLHKDGDVTTWTADIAEATAVSSNIISGLKAAAEESASQNIIIAPYVIDVVKTENGLQATDYREQIRAKGPTISLPRDSSVLSHEIEARRAA